MDPKQQKTYKSFSQLLRTVLTYSIGSFYFGYSMAYFNSVKFQQIHEAFDIQIEERRAEGIFSGCVPFGALFGAYLIEGNNINNQIRQSFILVDIIAILANLLILIPPFNILLLVGRILQGFCVGVFSSLVPLMVKEYSPRQLSGSFGAVMTPSIGVGFFSAYLISYLLTKPHDCSQFWYITFGFPILLILTQLYLLLKVYKNETPKYLLSQNRIEQARELLQHIYKPQHIQQILQQKLNDLHSSMPKIQKLNRLTSHQDNNQNHEQNQYSDQKQNERQLRVQMQCKTQKMLKDITENITIVRIQGKEEQYPDDVQGAVVFVYLLQTFHQLSGINVIVLYSAHLARQAVPEITEEIPLIINGVKIFMGLCGTLLLKKYGRRFMMLRGQAIIFCCLFGLFIGFAANQPQSSFFQALIVCCLLLYISVFVMTLGPITWLYIPQIVQPPTVPKTTMVNWILACIVVTLFPMIQHYTMQLFLFFSIITVLNFIMCFCFIIQTKDLKQSQIRENFVRRKQEIVRRICNIFRFAKKSNVNLVSQ